MGEFAFQTLRESITSAIRSKILTGELQPGAKLAEQRYLCDAHDGDQTAQHKAEQDGNGDHFHRKRQRRREPWEEPKEVGEIECKHSSDLMGYK